MILLGYATTFVLSIATLILVLAVAFYRDEIAIALGSFNRIDIAALILILAFFVAFSLLLMHPAEQLYFDENIYQGIAINILHHGNALWCQYGNGYLDSCYSNLIYHDPVEISFFLAIAFALFGIGPNTAYATQLLVGTFSVLLLFMTSRVLLRKRIATVTAAAIFALMPELLIWSRTQADPDLYFMMLATLSFFFFSVFSKRQNMRTLLMFMPSLVLAVYARMEGILLIPVFAILFLFFGEGGIRETFKVRLREIVNAIDSNTKLMVLILVFILLLIPQLELVLMSASNPSYGQPQGQAAVSLLNFKANIKSNVAFLTGKLNSIGNYPAIFPAMITYLAIIGAALLLFDESYKNRFGIVLMLGLWFATYFFFYTSFYAGAATFGVDVRFMLTLLPSLSILAAIGMTELSELIGYSPMVIKMMMKKAVHFKASQYRRYVIIAQTFLFIILVIWPFAHLYSLVTMLPSNMPQQNVILPVITFFYNNYQAVPTNCLVFSLTPDIWYEFNRSSAQISYVYARGDPRFVQFASKYSCFVLDYGYWCVVPPNHGGICATILSNFKHKALSVGQNTSVGPAPGFYELLNYTP
ncbi:MAG: ArnT family glycosyltransferase [Candidatus Micrarchaeia archaeon]